MGGKRSQAKGANGERELAAIIRSYGYDIQRGGSLSFGEIPDLSGLCGIHIECKRCEQLRISEWLSQAAADAERFQDGAPAVFFRRSREPWMVCMKLTDWLELYRGYQPPPGSNHGR